MRPIRIIQLGLLFLSLAIGVGFLPGLEILPEQFPWIEVAALLAIVAIFLLSIGGRRFRESGNRRAADDDEAISTHVALDIADGKLDGQHFSPHDDRGS